MSVARRPRTRADAGGKCRVSRARDREHSVREALRGTRSARRFRHTASCCSSVAMTSAECPGLGAPNDSGGVQNVHRTVRVRRGERSSRQSATVGSTSTFESSAIAVGDGRPLDTRGRQRADTRGGHEQSALAAGRVTAVAVAAQNLAVLTFTTSSACQRFALARAPASASAGVSWSDAARFVPLR